MGIREAVFQLPDLYIIILTIDSPIYTVRCKVINYRTQI